MDTYIPEELEKQILQLAESGKYDEAISLVNKILAKDPTNEQALLMVTDIKYRQWNMEWADKAVTFLNSRKKDYELRKSWNSTLLLIKWISIW